MQAPSLVSTPPFGELTPLLAPRSVAVIGASDREGNLGGVAVGFLSKFKFHGPIWPVNSGRSHVAGLPCYASLRELPGIPDLAILSVPSESVAPVLRECAEVGVPAAIVWAGGFAEAGEEGRARQRELEAICGDSGIKLCGPNCIGIINTSIGLTASFSSMMYEHDRLTPGAVSMVSQSGGLSVMAHARAQELGLGFRLTISCGNEASLGIPDFMHALTHDTGTRVIAVYTEGLSDAARFVEALAAARRSGKPVVMLKGGATEASGRAALAHTGRLAGMDRTYEAVFREFGVIRVHSTEELLDVCLQLSSMKPGQLPAGRRVLVSTFGGGSGVICTDQCDREGLQVPQLDEHTMKAVAPLLTPISSALNPVDMTPGIMTTPKYRANMPEAFRTLSAAPGIDSWIFLSSGFGSLAPQLVEMFDDLRQDTAKTLCLTWQAMPEGTRENLARRGIYTFTEQARAVRTLGYITRHAEDLRHQIHRSEQVPEPFYWDRFVSAGEGVISEHTVAGILQAARLPVARGQLATTTADAVRIATEIGFPVVLKGISPAITHRAAAGLVVLNLDSAEAVMRADTLFRERAAKLGVTLEGTWVQHMFAGAQELLVTAFRDREFGVMVGCGMGGGLTEVIDDVALARAPLEAQGAFDLLSRLRTLRRLPHLVTESQQRQAADFIASFSALVATAPWEQFTFEVNPLKLGVDSVAAVDGLLIIG